MHGKITATSLLAIVASVSAWPAYNNNSKAFSFPLDNGFPNITVSSDAEKQIEQQALGTLPVATKSSAPAKNISVDSVTALGFIAFNELFEVAFFTELISNITDNVVGYTDIPAGVLDILKVVQAQEELHELNANGAFEAHTGSFIKPCQYVFPVENFNDSIALASTFTDVVLGTLPDIQTLFANNNDDQLIRGVGAVIGQEGEQNGKYRDLLGKNPSANPFLTASAVDFAFSAINQNFVIPGSCPSLNLLEKDFKIFDVLNIVTPPEKAVDQRITISLQTQQTLHASGFLAQQQPDNGDLFITYINQQNAPISFPLEGTPIVGADNALQFTANFPGASREMIGLTIAAITPGANYSDVDAVAQATLFGPGLIEI